MVLAVLGFILLKFRSSESGEMRTGLSLPESGRRNFGWGAGSIREFRH